MAAQLFSFTARLQDPPSAENFGDAQEPGTVIDMTDARIEKLERRILELETRVDELETENASLRAENETLRDENIRLRGHLHRAEETIRELQGLLEKPV